MKTLILIFVLLITTCLYSTIINVPGDQPTIQAGIDAAADTDTVLVQPGTYVENINYNGKLITVASLFLTTQDTTYISSTVIDMVGYGCVVTFSSGEDSTAVLSGFTITDGYYGAGGGVICEYSSPTLKNLVITENYSQFGGGISCYNSSPSLVNVTITGNAAEHYGGGIYCTDSSPSLENVIISGNFASWGGGINCYFYSNPSLVNVTISGNASGGGGGISCYHSSPSLVNVTISGNTATSSNGGGISCGSSSPSLMNVTITGNTADEGGGISFSGGSPSLENVTISGNSADDKGGGIYCYYNSSLSLVNVTITGNSAGSYGGGIYCRNSNLNFDPVDRCNIFLNIAYYSGMDFYANNTIDVIVDTFTVLQPDDYFAYPIDNFTFDILNAKIEQVDQDLYVSPDGSDDNSGLTVDDPLLTVSYALAKILPDSTNPLTIHLSNGTYSLSGTGEIFPINCKSFVSLLGEYEASTILDGEGLSGILWCWGDNNFSIENMTIQNGSASNGGGIRCYNNSNPNLQNVIISDNSSIGILCNHSSPSLQNVTVSGNSSSGISCYNNSNPNLQNVIISDNSSIGILCNHSSPSLQNVTVSGNSSSGIYCSGSSPSLVNVTITGNSAGYDDGGGIYCENNSSPILINSILWNDSPEEIYFRVIGDPNSITISYSDIQGGEAGIVTNNNGTVNWLEGNIDEDPLFANPIEGDYHLTENSPCIDAGDPFYPPDPDGTRADMGAYYFHHIGGEEEVFADFYVDSTNVYIMLPVYFYDLSVAFNTEITTWLWDFDNDGTIDSYEQNSFYTYQNLGYYSVSLTVEDDIGNSNTMIKTDYITVYPPAYSGHIWHISPEGSDELGGNGSLEYPFATIQHGISVAENGDTVMVHQGTYPENINYSGKNITVASLFLTTQDTTYISQTIVDGDSSGSVVTFENGEDSTAILTGFTITNGQGGGSYPNNTGGGITCVNSSTPSLLNVTITGNSATDKGGGIYCYNSDPSLIDVMITGNTAAFFGGGIYCEQSSPSLENVTIADNSAYTGGGIYCLWNSSLSLENVNIIGNHAGSCGGGIWCTYNSSPSLVNVTISGNSAASWGGGIQCSYSSSPSLVNVTITGNSATHIGGGILCVENSDPELVNCILWNDSPEEIHVSNSSSLTATYSDIQGGWEGTGNIDEDPLFVGTGEDPYSLLEDSPCIDAGDPDTTGLNLPPWDIIGNLRIWDGDGDGIAIIDMGAYEYGAPPYVDIDDNVIVHTPEVFLHQNYPNPFNPTTTINYSLKENSRVSLNIYNIKGQKVKQLVSNSAGQLSAGHHSAVWNGKDDNGKTVSSGIYFYKLKTDNFEKTKKMILMK